MKRSKILNLIFAIFIATAIIYPNVNKLSADDVIAENKTCEILPFKQGEKFIYAVKMAGLSVGTSELIFDGIAELDGKEVIVIIFTTKITNFFDEEKIFADKETFLPIRVERNINRFGKKEFIVEEYDQGNNILTITKQTGNKETQQVIEKELPLQNMICFIYNFRRRQNLEIDGIIDVDLPLKKVSFQSAGEKKLKVYAGRFEAFLVQSVPKKYNFWLSADKDRIPLRIDGAVGFAKTRMILKDYDLDGKNDG